MKKILFLFLLGPFILNAQKSDFKNNLFNKPDSIANVYKNENLKSLPRLAHLLTYNLNTDVEKFRAIYIWVSKNIKGDYAAVSKNSRKRKKFKNNNQKLNLWNASFNKILFKKLLKNKKTVCTGYAYLIRELCNLTNIECKIIDGYGRNAEVNIGKLSIPNHSWNAVKLNNKWYLADATWSSGYTDLSTNTFIFDYNDGYFITVPTLFIKNHYPLNKEWSLIKKDSITINNFISAPLIYGEAFKNKLNPIFPKQIKNSVSKNKEILFKINVNQTIDEKKITIKIGSTLIKPLSISRKNNLLSIKFKFKNKGNYTVHLLYKKEVFVTCIFKVKN
jgi:transglutaminase/protease-like cytokinesis protein 3